MIATVIEAYNPRYERCDQPTRDSKDRLRRSRAPVVHELRGGAADARLQPALSELEYFANGFDLRSFAKQTVGCIAMDQAGGSIVNAMIDDLAPLSMVLHALKSRGVEPVLVGGLALVMLDSRRVTQDIDFVVSNSPENRAGIVDALYDAGFELGTWIDEKDRISETLKDRDQARLRAESDSNASELFFLEPRSLLEIDILLDFPLPASELMENSRTIRVADFEIRVADPADLLRMKRAAGKARSESRDAQDIDFLEKLIAKERSA